MSVRSEFNHAANDSPRSGSSKHVSPLIWCAITIVVVAVITFFVLR
jgi:hypothetical protein